MPLSKEIGLGPRHIVLDGDPAPTAAPPNFRPMPTVVKRSNISATAELLSQSIMSCDIFPCKDVPFWAFVDMPPHFGVKSQKKPKGGVNSCFQDMLTKCKNLHSKLQHRFQLNSEQ